MAALQVADNDDEAAGPAPVDEQQPDVDVTDVDMDVDEGDLYDAAADQDRESLFGVEDEYDSENEDDFLRAYRSLVSVAVIAATKQAHPAEPPPYCYLQQDATVPQLSDVEAELLLLQSDPWRLNRQQRASLHQWLLGLYREQGREELLQMQQEYNRAARLANSVSEENDAAALNRAEVVAMTTTAAARMAPLLARVTAHGCHGGVSRCVAAGFYVLAVFVAVFVHCCLSDCIWIGAGGACHRSALPVGSSFSLATTNSCSSNS